MPHKMININKLNKVCVEPPSSALSVMLPAFAAEHRRLQHGACSQLLIDISCLQDAQQQTRWPPVLLSIDGTDRRPTITQTLLRILCGQRR